MVDRITICHLSAFFGEHRALDDLNLGVAARLITALIG